MVRSATIGAGTRSNLAHEVDGVAAFLAGGAHDAGQVPARSKRGDLPPLAHAVRRLKALLMIPAESACSVVAPVTGWFARIAGETGCAQLQV